MIAPEGYVPLSILWDRIPQENFDAMYKIGMCFEKSDPKYALSVTVSDWLEVGFLSSLIDNAFIYSPDGRLLKFDIRLIRSDHLSIHDLHQLEKNYGKQGILDNSIWIAQQLLNFRMEDFIEEGLKGHDSYWEYSKYIGLQRSFLGVPFFYQRQSYTISLKVYDHMKKFNCAEIDYVKETGEFLRPYEGFSLCTPEIHANGKWLEYWKKRIPEEIIPRSSIGRPRTREKAVTDYKASFPIGHKQETWPQIMKKIKDKTGNTYSSDTLKRGLGLK